LNRKRVEPVLFPDVPVIFMAYDLLEIEGDDVRAQAMQDRRDRLQSVLERVREPLIRLSPILRCRDWGEVDSARQRAPQTCREGLMLKRLNAAYGVGRTKGNWWKLKSDPLTIDAVMIGAQQGHGKRATLFTDYTLAVWDGDELVTIAKAYSGLSDGEIREVDDFIRRNTIARRGPVRLVEPALVFELAFDGLRPSGRHKAGIALRFPRIARRRTDKPAKDADTLEGVRRLAAARGALT
jgi:DNA ligase-1